MPIKTCLDCGREISSAAKICPNCGKPNQKSVVVKILIGIAIFIALIFGVMILLMAAGAFYYAAHGQR